MLFYVKGGSTIRVADLHEERFLASIEGSVEIAGLTAGKSLMAVTGRDGSLRLLRLPDGGDSGIAVPVPANLKVVGVQMGCMSDERLLLWLQDGQAKSSCECRSGPAFAQTLWSSSDTITGIDQWCEFALLQYPHRWSVHMPTGIVMADHGFGPGQTRMQVQALNQSPFGVDHRTCRGMGQLKVDGGDGGSGYLISSAGLQCGLVSRAGVVARFEDGPAAKPLARIPAQNAYAWHLPDVGKLCVLYVTDRGTKFGFVDLPAVAPPSSLGIRLVRGRQDTARLPTPAPGHLWRLASGPKGLAIDGQGQCTWNGSGEMALGRYEAKLEYVAPDRSIQTVPLTVGLCGDVANTSMLPGYACAWMLDLGGCASRPVDEGFRDPGKQWLVDQETLTVVTLGNSGEFTHLDLVKGMVSRWTVPEAASATMGWTHAGSLTVMLVPGAEKSNGNEVARSLLIIDWASHTTRQVQIGVAEGISRHDVQGLHVDPAGGRLHVWSRTLFDPRPLQEIDLATGAVRSHDVYVNDAPCIDGDDIFIMNGRAPVAKMSCEPGIVFPISGYGRLIHYRRSGSSYKMVGVQHVPSLFGMVSQGLVGGSHLFVNGDSGHMQWLEKARLLLCGNNSIDLRTPQGRIASARFAMPSTAPVVGVSKIGDDRVGYVFRQHERATEYGEIAEFTTATVDAETGTCIARGTLRSDLDNMRLLGIAGDRHFFICNRGSENTVILACDAVSAKTQAMPAPTEDRPVGSSVTVAMVEARGVGVGSAFCVRSEAGRSLFATNCHVAGSFDPDMAYHLRLSSGTAAQRRMPAKLVAISFSNDLAILEIAAEAKPARWRSGDGDLRQGAPLTMIGFPLADDLAIAGGRLRETVSTASQIQTFGFELLFEGVASPGNSGGPLLDQDGCVVGVVRARSLLGSVGWAVRADKLQAMLVSSFTIPRFGRRRSDKGVWPLIARVQVVGTAPKQVQVRLLIRWDTHGMDRGIERADPLGPAVGRMKKMSAQINERNWPPTEGGLTFSAQPLADGVWEAVIPVDMISYSGATQFMTLRFEGTRADGSIDNSPWLTTRVAHEVDAPLEADGSTSSLKDQRDWGLLKPPGFIDICYLDGDVVSAQRCGEGRYLALQLAPSLDVALYDLRSGSIVRRFASTGSELLSSAGGWLLAMPEPSGAIRLHDLRQPDSLPRRLPPADLGRQTAIGLDDAGTELRSMTIQECAYEVRMTTSRIDLSSGKVAEREYRTLETRDIDPTWFIDPLAPFAKMPIVIKPNHAAISGLTSFLPGGACFTPASGELVRSDGTTKLAPGMLVASPDGKGLLLWSDDFALTLLDAQGGNPRPAGLFPLLMSACFQGTLPSDGSLRARQSLWLDLSANQITCIPPDLPRMVIRSRIKP